MIRYKRPDMKNTSSILDAAERDMKFTLSMKVTEMSGPTVVRNIYECFRMIGDALLVLQGIGSEDHLAPINALIKLQVKAERPVALVDNLRRLRHNINYYGYKPNLDEVADAVSMANTLFQPLLASIRKRLE